MQKYRLKKAFLFIVGAIILFAANDYFYVGGKDLSWAELASDEATITVVELDQTGEKLATHTLTKGQSLAMQTLLLRSAYLLPLTDNIRPKADESIYDIFIRFPEQDVSIHLTGSRYLSGDDGLLKIASKEWDTIFQGILAAG